MKRGLIKIVKKFFIVTVVFSFFANIFVNFPFTKALANTAYGQLFTEEIVLNEDYVQEDATILYEVKEKRKENMKAFRMSDGSLEYYYYGHQIHQKINDETYEEIDASFKTDNDALTSDAIDYQIKLPKKLSENKKIKFKYQNASLDITYDGIAKSEAKSINNIDNSISSVERLEGKVIYSNIFDGVDLEFLTCSNQAKENIILSKYINNFSLSYTITLNSLELIEEEGIIYFISEDKQVIYSIDPYFMYDIEDNLSYEITTTIKEIKKDEYQIIITPSDEWLKNASYPVVIDPTINYNQNNLSSYIKMKKITKGLTTTTTTNNVTVTKYIDSVTKENLSISTIMEIDFSNLPKDVMYSQAILRMRGLSDNVSTQTVKLNEITSNITFDTIKGTSSYNTTFLSTQKLAYTDYYNFELVDAINRNIATGKALFEFSPSAINGNDISVNFYGFNSSYKPFFILKCFDTTGLKDYWTYHSTDIGSAGIMYVNDFTGNLVIEKTDFINDVTRMSFGIKHYYNSSDYNEDLGYGNGWRINYSEKIIAFNGVSSAYSADYYILKDGTGNETYYKYVSNPSSIDTIVDDAEVLATYVAESGEDAIIEVISNDENIKYRRIVNKEYIYKYNTYGELVYYGKLDNLENEHIEIIYDTLDNNLRVIKEIIDTVGNKAVFEYEDGLLKNIKIMKKTYDDSLEIDPLLPILNNQESFIGTFIGTISDTNYKVVITKETIIIKIGDEVIQAKESGHPIDDNGDINEKVLVFKVDDIIFKLTNNNATDANPLEIAQSITLKDEEGTIEVNCTKVEEPITYEQAYELSYTYDDDNNLIKINEYRKENTELRYKSRYMYSNNKIVSILNYFLTDSLTDDYEGINVIYDDNQRVKEYSLCKMVDEVEVPNLGYTKISYDTQYTTFTQNDDYVINYVFDSYGHTINVYDNLGYAKYYKYETENSNARLNNKVIYESGTIYNGYNLIYNNSFEKYYDKLSDPVPGWEVEVSGGNEVSLNVTERLFGQTALRIKNTDSTNTPVVKQTIILKGQNTYKVGVYVKTIELDGYETGGANLYVTAKDYEGNDIVSSQNTYQTPQGAYTYYELTFTILGESLAPYDVTICLSTSLNTISYFDSINFSSGINDCRNNLLDDASFENYSQMSSNTSWVGGSVYTKEHNKIYGEYERRLVKGGTLYQVVDITPVDKINFTFGGFINTYRGEAKIRVRFYSTTSDSYSDYYIIDFNSYILQYQYLLDTVELESETIYDQVIFEVVNTGNTTISIDNLLLQLDGAATKYTYSEKGKLATIKSKDKETIIERNNYRDISSITYDNIVSTITEEFDEDNDFEKTTVNIDGTTCNISCTTYVNPDTKIESAILMGDINTGYFVTSTRYSADFQYIRSKSDEFGNITTYTYDKVSGLIKAIKDPLGNITNYEYNELDELITLIQDGRSISYTYNSFGYIETVKTDNLEYKFSYNVYGDIEKISVKKTTYSTYQDIVTYSYWMKNEIYTGLIQQVEYADGYQLTYGYSYDNNKLTSVSEKMPTDIKNTKIYSCIYNELGQVSVYTDFLTNTTYYNNYDIKGNLIKVYTDKGHYINYTYGGKNDNDTENDNYLREINYNLGLNASGTIEYLYDNDGNLISVYDDGSISTLYNSENGVVDVLGRTLSKTIINSLNDNDKVLEYFYEYYSSTSMNNINPKDTDENNLTSTRIEEIIASLGTNNICFKYKYDAGGNIIEILTYDKTIVNDSATHSNIKRYTYQYDQYNQLEEEKVYKLELVTSTNTEPNFDNLPYSNDDIILQTAYTYDKIGNIIRLERLIKLDIYSTLPSIITYEYNDISNPTHLTKYTVDGTIYNITYDLNGNPLNYLNYDVEFTRGTLTSLKQNNNTLISYEYNLDGLRTKKVIDNTFLSTTEDKTITYTYLGNVLITEEHSDGSFLKYLYDESGIIGFKYYDGNNINTYYYVKNLLGDIVNIVDINQNIVSSYTYDAYGNIINITGEIGHINPYRYRSYYYDSETALYYCNARYYNPLISRWISQDKVDYLNPNSTIGLNLYVYCNNNPIMNIDPSGCWTISFNLNIDFEFFGIISFHASVGIVIDDDFGCKLFYSQSDNFDDETSCIGFGDTGISFTTQITNLDSVNELFEKDTMSVGGSVGNYISELITDDITESSSPNIVGIGFGIGISPMPYSISIKKSKMYTHPGNYQGIGGLLREWLT